MQGNYPEQNPEHSPGSAAGVLPHMRRKSVLPGIAPPHADTYCIHVLLTVDPTVIRDLQAHRSLDDGSLRA
jgi:hypothetical protein